MATEALVAQVLIGKYSDHLPLYRQSQIFARQGIELDRSTLCNWVGRACWWLAPLHKLMLSAVLSSPKVFADDTTLPVLDPGNGPVADGSSRRRLTYHIAHIMRFDSQVTRSMAIHHSRYCLRMAQDIIIYEI